MYWLVHVPGLHIQINFQEYMVVSIIKDIFIYMNGPIAFDIDDNLQIFLVSLC